MSGRKIAGLLGLLVTLALIAAACGGSDTSSDDASSESAASESATEATGEDAPAATDVPAPTDVPATAVPQPTDTPPTEEPAPAEEEAPADTAATLDLSAMSATDDPALVAAGMAVFASNCAGCHGANGEGSDRGRPLTGIAEQEPDRLVHIGSVANGKGNMPAFGDRLSAADLDAVIAYSRLTFLAAEVEEAASDPAVLAMGAEVFTQACARCHGAAGEGTQRGRPMTGIALEQPDAAVHIASITDGKGNMPAFAESLSAEQISAVVAYVRETF